MTYYVIGLMSGSSLDGLDICYAHFTLVNGKKWAYEIRQTECIPYPETWRQKLATAQQLSVPEFLLLDTAYARFCAEKVNAFIAQNDLIHKVFFIASHGHTVFHDPKNHTSTQIGDGATIAALTGYTTISDLRNMDVALNGQGAPIVPMCDHLLFSDYDFCLNLGGIANVTVNRREPLAFDICPANQLLNFFAKRENLDYDKDGQLAKSGKVNTVLLEKINGLIFYKQPSPKSLNNDFSKENIIPILSTEASENAMATAVQHIAEQIAIALQPFCSEKDHYQMLITGGGALNSFLVQQIQQVLQNKNLPITATVPDEQLVCYKESLAMCLLGILRWREEENVLASVTGATRNSIGGALWLGSN